MEARSGETLPSLGEEKITVAMRQEFLFDFFLYHAYSKFSGFLTNILGFSIFILGVYSYWLGEADGRDCAFFVAAAALFIAATPLQLKWKARRAMKEADYRLPLDYTFTDREGILVEREGSTIFYPWEKLKRAAVAPKTIILYVGDEQALVLPKESFGDKFAKIYQIIAVNLGRSRYLKAEAAESSAEAAVKA